MAEPIPFERFYDLTQPTELELSPDGELAAVVAAEFDAEEDERLSSVFVVPTDGSRKPHRLTRASGASSPRWSPDGSKLAVLAARDEDLAIRVDRDPETDDDDENGENAGSDDPKSQVWVYDLDMGGDPRQVTDFEEGVREFDWSPDGDRLVVSARDPTDEQREYLKRLRENDGPIEVERLQHKADGVGWLDDVRTYLFVVDLGSRETTRLDDAYGAGASEPQSGLNPTWSPDGERIAFTTNRTDRPDDSNVLDLYTIAPDGSDLTAVTDADVSVFSPAWDPSGDRLAFVSRNPTNWYVPSEVYVADLESGTYDSVSASLDRTASGYRGLRWLDDDRLVGCIGDEGLTRPVVFDANEDAPERVFPVQGRDRELALFDCRGGTLAAGLSDSQNGVDLYVASEDALHAGADGTTTDEDADLTRVTAFNDDLLDDLDTPRSHRITYPNGEGDEVEAIAYLPDDFDPEDPDPRGLILSIHGGPMSYDAPSFDFPIACWTSRGYLVVKPNYRGSTSYGRDFCETLAGRWGTQEVVDQAAAVETLIERGWVDPERTFSTGFSYGGISTGYLVTQTDLFTAAAAEHGLYDMRSSFGTDDCHLWWEGEYGLPWEEAEAFEAISSITDVGNVDTPLLITAGEDDWRCPPTQSEQLYVSVKKQGVPARLVVYRNESHAITDPDRAIHRLEELTGWFERFDPAVEADSRA